MLLELYRDCLLYALTVRQLFRARGERGLARVGGTIVTFRLSWLGPGHHAGHGACDRAAGSRHPHAAQHSTDQRDADDARVRGLAISIFAKCCSSAGLAVRRSGGIGFAPVFMALGVALAVLAPSSPVLTAPPRSEPVEASP